MISIRIHLRIHFVDPIRNATSTHETISSSIEPPLLLNGTNYWAHRFRLRQQSDASSHSFDSTKKKVTFGIL